MFDREVDVDVSARNRPHWDQNGAATFVTIRLADSMPKAVVARWLAEQDDWLKAHGLDSERRSHDSPSRELSRFTVDSESRTTMTEEIDSEGRTTMGQGFDSESRDAALAGAPRHLQRAFRKFKNQRWHENLDNCHGKCLLRDNRFATIVADSLLAFDGSRYDVERFVIMPNHVHMLVQMRLGWRLREQCESWMRFTGRRINALNQTAGMFWSEPFDHVVRNEAQFQYLQEYIADNPRKAKLPHGDYVLWIRGAGFIVARLSES
jgi:REP element-mobilizing transposase RayT